MSVCAQHSKAWGKQWESTSNLWSLMAHHHPTTLRVYLLLVSWYDDFPPALMMIRPPWRTLVVTEEKKTQNTCDLPLRQWPEQTFIFHLTTHRGLSLSFEPATMDVVQVSTQCKSFEESRKRILLLYIYIYIFFFLFELWQAKEERMPWLSMCRRRKRVSW